MFMRTISLVMLGILTWVSPSGAQSAPPEDDQTISDYRNAARERFRDRMDEAQSTSDAAGGEAASQAKAAVKNSPTTVSTGDGFADRVNDSLADFLPLFQFAVDAVSTAEDKESVTVKFNPIDTEKGAVAVQATIADPEIFKPLLDEIAEPVRDSQTELLKSQAGDFGDVVVSATWGLQRSIRGQRWGTGKRLWGRSPKLYGDLVEDVALSLLTVPLHEADAARRAAQIPADNQFADLLTRLATLAAQQASNSPDLVAGCSAGALAGAGVPASALDIQQVTFGQIKKLSASGCLGGFDADAYAAAETAFGDQLAELGRRFETQPSVDGLVSLIDNQPQLTVTGSYRFRDDVVGPDSWNLSLKWEMGSRNLNAVLQEYRWLEAEGFAEDVSDSSIRADSLRAEAFARVSGGTEARHRAQNRWTFTAAVNHSDALEISHSYELQAIDPQTMMEIEIPRSATVVRDSLTDLTFNVQWSRLVRWGLAASAEDQGAAENRVPRLSVSVEGQLFDSDDPDRKDRVVGRLSYTVPLPSGMSLPFTVTYANRGEFLGEQDEKFSAHLGLSYKLSGGDS